MGRQALIQEELESGQLIDLFPERHSETEYAYYLVYKAGALDNPRIKAVHDWLKQQGDCIHSFSQ